MFFHLFNKIVFNVYWYHTHALVLTSIFLIPLILFTDFTNEGIFNFLFQALTLCMFAIVALTIMGKSSLLAGYQSSDIRVLETKKIRKVVNKELEKFEDLYKKNLHMHLDYFPVRNDELTQVVYDFRASRRSLYNTFWKVLFSSSLIGLLAGWQNIQTTFTPIIDVIPNALKKNLFFSLIIIVLLALAAVIFTICLCWSSLLYLHAYKTAEQLLLRRHEADSSSVEKFPQHKRIRHYGHSTAVIAKQARTSTRVPS